MLSSKTVAFSNLKLYISKQLQEIDGSRALQFYGAILCLTHILTAYFWWPGINWEHSICWSFASGCAPIFGFLRGYSQEALISYAVISGITAGLFIFRKVRIAWMLFGILCLFKILYHVSDYRLMGNYHYMSHIVNFSFLLLSYKKQLIKAYLVLFYLAAGSIKFNSDWLTGAAMLRTPMIQGKWLELGCAYVIVLEMVLVPLLILSKNRWVHFAVLVQLFFFHLFSWHIVRYFYPLVMLSLLSIFVLIPENFKRPKGFAFLAAIGIFILAQAVPMMIEPSSALNGRARILSLNMLDAKAICETRFYIRFADRTIEYAPSFKHLGVRIQCDPLVVVDHLKRTCKDQESKKGFVDIDIDHQVRNASDGRKTEQFTYQDACSKPLTVSFLGYVQQK